jgi:hypothetical protein
MIILDDQPQLLPMEAVFLILSHPGRRGDVTRFLSVIPCAKWKRPIGHPTEVERLSC